jgi:hypothetical protein
LGPTQLPFSSMTSWPPTDTVFGVMSPVAFVAVVALSA